MHPSVYEAFREGHFTVQLSGNTFSRVAVDQAHEQNNAKVKGDGGAIGLTENPTALHRWMVAGPEMVRLLEEFESSKKSASYNLHHEQTKHAQQSFFNDVKQLSDTIEKMGNPFADFSPDLVVLDTRDIMDPLVSDTVRRKLETLGEEQYQTFVNERLTGNTTLLTDPIKTKQFATI